MKFRALLSALWFVAGIMLVTGCDSPEKGFKEWKAAILKGDIEKANNRTTASGQMLNVFLAGYVEKNAEAKKEFEALKIVSCTRNGDRATLKIKNASGQIKPFDMVKKDGKWKVDPKKDKPTKNDRHDLSSPGQRPGKTRPRENIDMEQE